MNKVQTTFYCLLAVLIFFPLTSHGQNCADPNGDIWVLNTNDEGDDSFRAAIQCANTTPGANTIRFNIPGSAPHVIFVGSDNGAELPALLDENTIIDGTTQPGYAGAPVIVLDGQHHDWELPINAVWVRADHCEIYGLEIMNFPDDAIDVRDADQVRVGAAGKGNFIHDNGSETDFFPGLPGTGPWEGCGIVIREGSDDCTVQGNTIADNEYCGIRIRGGGDDHRIGGDQNGEENVIHNNAVGIRISANTNGTRIQQNSLFCNDTLAIALLGNANDNISPPEITDALALEISGTAGIGDQIEVFLVEDADCTSSPCQGKVLLGVTSAPDGNWSLVGPFLNGINQLSGGQIVTATATDAAKNTSEFSVCEFVSGVSFCTDQFGDIWVTNTNDAGPGSLRDAIDCANATLGANTIKFNIPGNMKHVIRVGEVTGEALPALIDAATTIDATTQTGFGFNGNNDPRIVLDGQYHDWTAPINAVWIRGDYCEIYALEIINFPDDGIDVTDADFVKIGDAGKGNVIYRNGYEQDFFPDAPGTGPWNGCGIVMKLGAENCEIKGNIVGTDYTQTDSSGNELCGIVVQNGGDENIIGGNEPGEGNIIAHHTIGIRISNNSFFTTISANSMYCNDSIPILLLGNANMQHPAPVFDSVTTTFISGFADTLDQVEVFMSIDTLCEGVPCQGTVYLGTAQVADSSWILEAPFENNVILYGGEQITATATDTLGNTSVFAACVESIHICDLEITVSNLEHTSCGEDNGSIVIETNGGTPPFIYDIGNGPVDDPEFLDLAAGTYEIMVFDTLNCSDTLQVIINPSTSPEASASNIEDATCGEDNGAFTVEVVNGVSPYTFDIGNGPTNNPEFNSLSAGTYSVTVTDAENCEDILSVTIISVNSLEVSVSQVMSTTCGEDNGSFVANASGGTAPYVYDIGNGPTNDPEFTGLAAGTYTVTVRDDDDCEVSTTVTINAIPPPVASIIAQNDASCGGDNGSFTVGVSGGTAPYLFDIGNGQTGNPEFTNLSPGDYSVTVTDADDCEDVVEVSIGSTNSLEAEIIALVHTSCGNNNGAFTVSVTSGTAPYTYDIGNGPTGNPEFTALAPGTYEILVEDAEDCSAILNAVINPSSAPAASISQVMDATCGLDNGSFLVGVINGSPPYSFDIGDGPTNDPEFTNLSAGNYTVTVTDQEGCIDTESVTISSTGGPQALIEDVFDSTCDQNNGSFSVNANNGTPPYEYDIGNGPTANNEFNNLAAGSYTVTVTDVNDCSTTASVVIFETGTPEPNFTNIENETCELSNGSFTISVNGGVSGYLYDIGDGFTGNPNFTGLMAGDYTVTVIDAVGCTATETTTLVNEGIEPFANFAYTVDEATVFFTNLSLGAVNYLWDFGDLGISMDENPIHIYQESGDYLVCLTIFNDCGEDTFCENVTINLPLSLVNIYGNIAKENGQTVGSVSVNCTDTSPFETEIDGNYEFLDLPAGGDYLIEPVKDFNYGNGLSAFDIFLISQHILNVEPLDSPYKIIAADVDNNGSISALDLFRIQQVILNNIDTFPNNTSWRFVPAAFNFPDPADPLSFPFPETIALDDLNMDAFNQDFVAIKVGDVNLSADPAALNEPEEEVRLSLIQKELPDGTLVLEFQSAENQSFVAFQTLQDLGIYGLKLDAILAGTISPAFKTTEAENHLQLLWYHDGNTPDRQFAKGEVLFQLIGEKRGFDRKKIEKMQFDHSEVYDSNGDKAKVRLETGTLSENQQIRVMPNPVATFTTIRFDQKETGIVKVNLFTARGDIIYVHESFFEKGKQQLELDMTGWPAGIYFFELSSGGEFSKGKMVKM